MKEIHTQTRELKGELQERTSGYIITGLGVVAGLAWNEAIKEIIALLFPLSRESVIAKIAYALIVTLMVIVLGVIVKKIFSVKKNTEKDREFKKRFRMKAKR